MRLVSAADKLHNARAILADYREMGEALWDRFNGGKEGTLWYYRSLVEAFREASGSTPLVEELDRVVSELERLALAEPDAVLGVKTCLVAWTLKRCNAVSRKCRDISP